MLWRRAMTSLPWRAILTHAPTLVDVARRAYAGSGQSDHATKPAQPSGDALERLQEAVARLEERDAEEADLVAGLVRQAQAMASALDGLRVRTTIALALAALAVVLAGLCAALLLWR
jgi:hypothetical protein